MMTMQSGDPTSPKVRPDKTERLEFQTQNAESSEEDLNDAEEILLTDPEKLTPLLESIYKSELTSEAIQRRSRCALAHYQVLLSSSAPVLAHYVHKRCSICLDDLLRNYLCKHQIPNVRLRRLWDWYTMPGAHGLEVGLEGMDLRPFCAEEPADAYFSACLSAIQLFQASNSRGVAKSMGEGSDPFCSDNCELVYEFFETEPIGIRPPFMVKIRELVKAGPSNPEAYGDPLKLVKMKLRKIHPASWFAVSWTAIYQIPIRGKFEARFLTYHSLGYFVQKYVRTRTLFSEIIKSCIVSPTIGMESCNTEDEGWFEERIPSDRIPREFGSFNCTNFLNEQRASLQKIAQIYSKACVVKNGVKVINNHPDYKDFISGEPQVSDVC